MSMKPFSFSGAVTVFLMFFTSEVAIFLKIGSAAFLTPVFQYVNENVVFAELIAGTAVILTLFPLSIAIFLALFVLDPILTVSVYPSIET